MALAKIESMSGRAVYVPGDDIDTDRIIPARYLRCVTFDGLGAYAFYDVRFDADDKPLGHPLDDPKHAGASVLVSGKNFGCGSSREHAPQSLYYFGIRGVVAQSFAEIFFGNATTLGIVCLALEGEDWEDFVKLVEAHPDEEAVIDVREATVTIAGRSLQGKIPKSSRHALAEGQWDPLAQLLEGAEAVAATATALPPPPGS